MSGLFGWVLVAVLTLGGPSLAGEERVSPEKAPNAAMKVDPQTLLDLQAENDALRRENQMLRRELVARKGTLPATVLPEKVVEPAVAFEIAAEDTGYWLSQKSKIRHNSRCRNYRKVKGRPCGPHDGKPCKMCGG